MTGTSTFNANFLTVPVAGSSYPVITYGSETGSGAIVLGQLGLRNASASLDFSHANVINLAITSFTAGSLTWTGANAGAARDANTTQNWKNASGAADVFDQFDNVAFTDASSVATVTLNTTASPSSITVSSNTTDYIITGTGTISGPGALDQDGHEHAHARHRQHVPRRHDDQRRHDLCRIAR